MARIAIIGAGMAGLACARALVASRHQVVILEKSRSLGGRCASRLFEGAVIDTGAQYFSITDPRFRSELRHHCADGVAELLAPVVFPDGTEHPAGSKRHYHKAGNNRLGKALATGLEIRRETPVETLEIRRSGIHVCGDTYDAAVCTAPWPQTAGILNIPESHEGSYEPCLTAAFAYTLRDPGEIPRAYAILDPNADLAWSACENHKASRVPDSLLVFIAQASAEFSRDSFDVPRDVWAARLRGALEQHWNLNSECHSATFTHRWKFSRRLTRVSHAMPDSRIRVIGDSVSESKVEAAWISGHEAGCALAAELA